MRSTPRGRALSFTSRDGLSLGNADRLATSKRIGRIYDYRFVPFEAGKNFHLGPEVASGSDRNQINIFSIFHGGDLHARGFEDDGIYWKRESRDRGRQGEMHLDVAAWLEFACRIIDVDFSEQCACCIVDRTSVPHDHAVEMTAREFRKRQLGVQSSFDLRRIHLRDIDVNPQTPDRGEMKQ